MRGFLGRSMNVAETTEDPKVREIASRGITENEFRIRKGLGDLAPMTPTKRIARDLAGIDPGLAYALLIEQLFTPAEAAEIVAGCSLALQRRITSDQAEIETQITATIETSIGLGDRLPDEING